MRCDQYFEIPKSFQKLKCENNKTDDKNNKNKCSENKRKAEKDFLDFLEEIISPNLKRFLPSR